MPADPSELANGLEAAVQAVDDFTVALEAAQDALGAMEGGGGMGSGGGRGRLRAGGRGSARAGAAKGPIAGALAFARSHPAMALAGSAIAAVTPLAGAELISYTQGGMPGAAGLATLNRLAAGVPIVGEAAGFGPNERIFRGTQQATRQRLEGIARLAGPEAVKPLIPIIAEMEQQFEENRELFRRDVKNITEARAGAEPSDVGFRLGADDILVPIAKAMQSVGEALGVNIFK